MKIAFISRDKGEKDVDMSISKKLKVQLDNLAARVKNHEIRHEIRVYAIAKFEKKDELIGETLKTRIIKSDDPASSVSMNLALDCIKKENEFKPDAFFVWSKEVDFEIADIDELADEIRNNENLLVAGFKFKHVGNEEINSELNNYYADKNLIAYQVPWNTCAMWNYKLFDEYVKKFDEITLGKYPFQDIPVIVKKTIKTAEHKGMEDGLAIAQAVSQPKGLKDIKFKLIEKSLNWEIRDGNDGNGIEKHLKKLARKEAVMRNFMAMRNYAVEDLKAAKA